MVVVFLFVAMVTFRNGPFVRPHPAFWRAVTGMGILYLLVRVLVMSAMWCLVCGVCLWCLVCLRYLAMSSVCSNGFLSLVYL